MERHEKRCTANPDRECGFCIEFGDVVQQPVSELIEVFEDAGGGTEGLKKLREATANCPACILATLRQAPRVEVDSFDGMGEHGTIEISAITDSGFDWNKESKAAYAELNAARNEQQYYY